MLFLYREMAGQYVENSTLTLYLLIALVVGVVGTLAFQYVRKRMAQTVAEGFADLASLPTGVLGQGAGSY